MGPVLLKETVNSYSYIQFVQTLFCREVMEEEITCGSLIQDGTTAHTLKFELASVEEVFSKRLISCGL
jgi:hypothetical protein